VATAVLCFLAAALATAVPGRNLAKIIFTAATAVYVVTFFWIPALARVVSPSLAPWLPTAGLALASAVLLRVRRLTPSN
jgi:lipopolysaccharide export LptBFGC system permease protein LptF